MPNGAKPLPPYNLAAWADADDLVLVRDGEGHGSDVAVHPVGRACDIIAVQAGAPALR